MAKSTADKSRLLALAESLLLCVAIVGGVVAGCAAPPALGATPLESEPGDQKSEKKKDKKKSPAPAPGAGAPSKPDGGSSGNAAAPTETWSLVLSTFSGDDHAQSAQNMLGSLRKIAPQATDQARVHTTAKGSMVVYGNYTGRDDAAAIADEQRLKKVTYQNRPVFNRIILTRIDLRLTHGQLSPNDLLSARRKFPKVDPLYTLDVALWIANEDPKAGKERLDYEQVKRRAEEQATALRAQGFEAYFYHDPANKRSIVTVGLFDRRAINPTSGLYSQQVSDLLKRFPQRLANGEPAFEFKNKFFPDQGTKPQSPVLVLVPTM
jgi:hypothetical protein